MGVPPANQRDPVVVIIGVAPGTAQDLASWDTLNLGEQYIYVYVQNFLCIPLYREQDPWLQTVPVLKIAEASLATVDVCSEISA